MQFAEPARVRWKKTRKHREKWTYNADVIVRTSNEVIEGRFERLWLSVHCLHFVLQNVR